MQVWDPDVPGQYDEDAYGSRIMNPMAANAADMTYQTDRVVGSLGLDFKITRNLSFKTTYSIDLNNSRDDYYLDPVSTSDGRSTKGAVSEGTSRNLEWLFENVLSYDNTFNLKHKFSAMAGATLQHAQWNGNNLAGFDLPEAYPQIHSVAAAKWGENVQPARSPPTNKKPSNPRKAQRMWVFGNRISRIDTCVARPYSSLSQIQKADPWTHGSAFCMHDSFTKRNT